jgi:hypothetical protein
MMNIADVFILYDHVQYTKNDWRNRNRIKTQGGVKWLTVPVKVKDVYPFPIHNAQVIDHRWVKKHWRTIQQSYARAPYFNAYAERFEAAFTAIENETYLTRINEHLIRTICEALGILTSIHRDTEFELSGDKSGKLVNLCRQVGADTYLSGPAAKDYLDISQFDDAGITVEWMDYSDYPTYEQPYPPFEHGVSVLDLIFCTGPDAPHHMKSF